MRVAGGSLGIPELTRCHAVMGQSPDPRDDTLSQRCDGATVTARALSRAAASTLSKGASEPPDESVRSADERLSILELTRCHAMVGQSPGRRVDHLSGRRDRYGASTERARRDESLKSDPRNGIARLRLGLVTKPSTVIENMILK